MLFYHPLWYIFRNLNTNFPIIYIPVSDFSLQWWSCRSIIGFYLPFLYFLSLTNDFPFAADSQPNFLWWSENCSCEFMAGRGGAHLGDQMSMCRSIYKAAQSEISLYQLRLVMKEQGRLGTWVCSVKWYVLLWIVEWVNLLLTLKYEKSKKLGALQDLLKCIIM